MVKSMSHSAFQSQIINTLLGILHSLCTLGSILEHCNGIFTGQ